MNTNSNELLIELLLTLRELLGSWEKVVCHNTATTTAMAYVRQLFAEGRINTPQSLTTYFHVTGTNEFIPF